MKTCTVCGQEKPEEEFYRKPSGKNGLCAHCKACDYAKRKANHEANLERDKARGETWRAAHADWIKAKKKADYAANPRRARDLNLRRAFGISVEEYEGLLKEQQGRCAVCGSTDPRGKGTFHVDHDHATGQVRALLCHHCNVGLGHFGDDPDRLLKAAHYLVASRERLLASLL